MIDGTKISNKQEQELSMDEILSSIRNIITEDQEAKSDVRRTFPEESTTNPSGARMMSDLPKFDRTEDFELPNFNEGNNESNTLEARYISQPSVFPDEDFEIQHSNERSVQEQRSSYYQQEKFAREAYSTEDRISKALKGIVESYGQRNTYEYEEKVETVKPSNLENGSNRLTELINSMAEKIMIARIEEWLNKHLPGMLEKALVRELERLAVQMKF